ncbi:MAG: hypothetical protein IJK45_00200 [Bacteroidaceae bacterium]|nr:hypothetical protein [Bacteroidaceae bacterium]
MKKYFLMAAALLLGAVCMVSCGDDDVETPGGNDPINPDVTPANEVWAPAKQKQYLEDVGMEVNQVFNVEDFRHYIELANYVGSHYGDDYDWDAVEDWGDGILDGLMSELIRTDKKTENDEWTGGDGKIYRNVYNEFYDVYRSTILASNFRGHWTARNGKWTRTDADDLQFIFANKSGQQCVLSLATSGKVTKVHMFHYDEWKNYESEGNDDWTNYVSNEYYDRTEYTLGVPEKIEVKLTEGDRMLVHQVMTTDLGSITNEEFDLSRSTLTFNSTTTFDNGYVITAENVKYAPSSASLKTTITKNQALLLTATLSCGLSNVPARTLNDWYDLDDDELEDIFAKSNATAAFSLNVLGKVQLKGTISDLHKLVDYIDEANDNDENEQTFKNALKKANGCLEAVIYYNGGTAKQATMGLEAIPDRWTDWEGHTYTEWYAEPTLYFPDGSSYSFEEYFNEDDFKDLIDAVEEQGEIAEDMWD